MADPLKVLVWGSVAEGPCAYFRGTMFYEELAKLGVEVRDLTAVEYRATGEYKHFHANGEPACDRCHEAFKAGAMELDMTQIEWADVIFFRRYYNTSIKCRLEKPCGFLTHDWTEASKHEHGFKAQDSITADLWPIFRDHMKDAAIVYDTDDNHFEIKPWNGFYGEVLRERDLITDMVRRADLVTVSVPDLVSYYSRYNKNIRVIRNAVDPALYVADEPKVQHDKPRLVYYGGTARLRDYAGRYVWGNKEDGGGYAYRAVEENAHLLTRVFIGADSGTEDVVGVLFDEVHPFVDGIAKFSKYLANINGDIGIAPLGGDDFDKGKSELHWLEYALTDMAFIGERFRSGGPYSVVRDGVDGLVVRGAQQWYDAVRRLAKSPDLRLQLAGAAKERVLAEYDYRTRAIEWADAFKWAYANQRDKESVAA
jgi:hypothetical protein